jgi:predicted small lipoprotein YifL
MKQFLLALLLGVLATVLLASLAGCARPCGDPDRDARLEKAHQHQ